jgi:hypothetical protein
LTQSLVINIKGLYTYPSDLAAVPQGALSVADNIVIDKDSIAEPRRGFGYLTHGAGVQSAFSNASYRANKIYFYQNQILCSYSTALLAYHNSSSGWVNYSGTYTPPASTSPVRSAQSNNNFYFTTINGVNKLDSYTGTPVAVGAPQALDLQTSIAVAQTPTATVTNTSAVLTSLSSIAGLGIGMSASGTGIPSNSYIVSFNGATVTLNNAATASNSGVTVTFDIPATWLLPSIAAGTNAYITGYRILWTYTDANQNQLFGAPSQFSQLSNYTAGTVASIVNFSIPPGVTTSYQYQIYRSPAVASGTPTDEEQLCYQGSPTAADLTYGTISVLDLVPDALLNTTIYTAQSQEGLANENLPAPLALDIADFRNCMFYANTSTVQNYTLNLLGTGPATGVQSGDTIVIGGVTYTAGSTETISSGTFAVAPVVLVTPTGNTNTNTTINSISSMASIAVGQSISGTGIPAGTFITSVNVGGSSLTISQAATASASITLTITGDSAAQAIRDTALSLIRVINRYASSTVFAYYLSGPTDLPGQIYISGKSVGASAFTLTSSRATCWSPALPSSGSTQISTNSSNKNYLYYSKVQQPEAVPVGNYLPVGSADKNILRIIALRDSLFILKEDGIFYLTGTDPTNFQVWPLDLTTRLIAAESAVSLNNQIYCLTTQGVVSITQNGVAIMSRPIEDNLLSLVAANYATLQATSFGVAYESSRAYYLFCITNATDTGPTQYFRYNYLTNTWTHSVISKTCGGVNPLDDKLYCGNAVHAIIDVENKNFDYTDYSDYQSTQTISAVSGTSVTISSSDTIEVGSIIFQSNSVFGTVASVNTITGVCTTTLATNLATGAADILAPISCNITWIPTSFANPGITNPNYLFANPGLSKRYREVALLFYADFNGSGSVVFTSDVQPTGSTELITGGYVGGWGLFGWGGTNETPLGVPWGGDPRRRPIRIMVPRQQQRVYAPYGELPTRLCLFPLAVAGHSVRG